MKYLVQWREFTTEHDIWEREENLENAKEVVTEFEERLSIEVRRQEKLDIVEKRDFRKGKLPEKYIVETLYE